MFYRDFSSRTFGKSTLEKFLEYPGKGEKRERCLTRSGGTDYRFSGRGI